MSASRYGIIIIALTGLLGACTSDKPGQQNKVFSYNQHNGISSLDPAFAKDQPTTWGVNQLFNGLVQLDDQLNIQPCIAHSWEVDSTNTVYTFHLRQDVYFHDHQKFNGGKGRQVVAKDFLYSFNRLMDPTVASPGAWIFNGVVKEEMPFETPNDSTFIIHLQKPFIPFLGILTMQYCSVVPKEVTSFYGKDFRRNPIGTGPFKMKIWEEKEVLLLVKHENYFEKDAAGIQLPYIDGVKVTFMESKSTEFLNFKQGKLSFMSSVDESFINDVLDKDGNLKETYRTKFKLQKSPFLNVEYLGFLHDPSHKLVKDHALKDKRIRQAINYGLDRNRMMTYLRNSVGLPANSGFVPAGLPSFNPEKVPGFTYDPERSRQLLEAAGYPNGKGLPVLRLYTNPVYQDLCAFFQSQMAEIGVTVLLETVKPSYLRELKSKSEALFFRASWIADYPDPESFLACFYGKNPVPPNYTLFKNERFDQLYELANSEPDANLRIRYFQQMDSILVAEAPIVPLYYDEALRFVQNNISGLDNNPMNLLVLKHAKIK